MTAVLTDRLTHESYVINMNGNSYRIKEIKGWFKTLNGNQQEYIKFKI